VKNPMRPRFWLETGLAVLTGLLALVTQFSPNWIELVFRFDPDHDSGSLERVLVAVCLGACVASVLLARAEFRRAATQSSQVLSVGVKAGGTRG
jgi:hypothetical protein